MRRLGLVVLALGGVALGNAAGAEAVTALAGGKVQVVAGSQAGLEAWIGGFRARALAAGIGASSYDRALAGARFDPGVIEKDLNQNEFTKTIWDYLDTAVSDLRVGLGREALARHRGVLERIEARYGVDKHIVVAVWGLESSYGSFRGDYPVAATLATLAYASRRKAFFESQLLAALNILEKGDTTPERMLGSWAGAMGHTQFMPTSYASLAVDFTGDGRRDIWGDDPTDALASTAAYLAAAGWQKGGRWGLEVTLPKGFDYESADDAIRKPVATWQALGVRAADGRELPDHGPATVILPGGARGAAFLIFANFRSIETYNTADAYVIAVGHLADRIQGGPPIRAGWPRDFRALTLPERLELQDRLTKSGFDAGGSDGRIGPKTIAAVRAYQKSLGLVPDGYASMDVLLRLR